MKSLTLRTNSLRREEREKPKHPLVEGIAGEKHAIKPLRFKSPGPKVWVSSRSMWRGYWYAKKNRVWSYAERVVSGMRLDYYRSSGKNTPRFAAPEHLSTQIVSGRMKEIAFERNRVNAHKSDSRPEAHIQNEGSVRNDEKYGAVIPINIHPTYRHLRLASVSQGEEKADVIELAPYLGIPTASKVAVSEMQQPHAVPIETLQMVQVHATVLSKVPASNSNPFPNVEIAPEVSVQLIKHAIAFLGPDVTITTQKQDGLRLQDSGQVRFFANNVAANDSWMEYPPQIPHFDGSSAKDPVKVQPAVIRAEESHITGHAMIGIHTSSEPRRFRAHIGYYGSGKRKTIHLKVAQGAASQPQ